MVAGGDEDGRADDRETAGQLLAGLVIAVVAVEEVARQQDELHLLLLGKGRQAPEKLPLLAPSEGGLARGQGLKGGVEMQVGGVEDF